MTRKVLLHPKLWQIVGLIALDSAFFTFTNSNKVASVVLMLGFLLLAATLYVLLERLIYLSRYYGLPFGRQSVRIALFLTGVIAGLIGLQSMGELTARDLLVALPLGVIAYLYLSYGREKPQTMRVDTT